jgi:hypothetical protein
MHPAVDNSNRREQPIRLHLICKADIEIAIADAVLLPAARSDPPPFFSGYTNVNPIYWERFALLSTDEGTRQKVRISTLLKNEPAESRRPRYRNRQRVPNNSTISSAGPCHVNRLFE